MTGHLSRRDFVASAGSLGAIWLIGDSDERRQAVSHAAHQLAQPQPTFLFFTPEQAAEVDAMASRIIPADDTPGAREAGVVYFIDKSLTTWARDQQGDFRDGLAKLERDVGAVVRGQTRLAALTPAQQDDVIRSIETTDFFEQVRFATLAGMLSLPQHGGNRDFIGWAMIGQQPAMEFRPPFGWYDDPANRPTGGDS